MSQIDVIEQLKQRFAEPLGECAQRRIMVWHDADGEFEGALVEVEDDGHLILHDRQGRIRSYAFGEISIVRE